MEKLYVDKDAIIDKDKIIEYVLKHSQSEELSRLEKLENYFKNKNTYINNRDLATNNAYNNLVASGYARYITNTINGYFIGKKDSITYVFPDNFEAINIEDLLRYNDEHSVNIKLGEAMSIYGYAIEQLYIDSNAKLRFANIDPKNVIILFEDNIDQDIHSVIKYRKNMLSEEYDDFVYNVEYYTKDKILLYKFKNNLLIAESEEELDNVFGDVPFIYYENANEVGDFETIISLIDEYDKTISNVSNMFDYFNDAYLVFSGDNLILQEEVSYDENGNEVRTDPLVDMKQNKCFVLPANSKVEFLAKPNVSTDSINYLEVIRNDIHKFSHCPDLTDKEFYTNSGIAIKYKLQSLEYIASIKESNFRKGLTRRFEIMSNFLNIKNQSFDFSKIEIIFTRNTIENLAEVYDAALKLRGIVSDKTLLESIPGINVEIELERLEEQKEANMEEFNNYNFSNNTNNQVPDRNEEELDNEDDR